jgi:hypothetical protein
VPHRPLRAQQIGGALRGRGWNLCRGSRGVREAKLRLCWQRPLRDVPVLGFLIELRRLHGSLMQTSRTCCGRHLRAGGGMETRNLAPKILVTWLLIVSCGGETSQPALTGGPMDVSTGSAGNAGGPSDESGGAADAASPSGDGSAAMDAMSGSGESATLVPDVGEGSACTRHTDCGGGNTFCVSWSATCGAGTCVPVLVRCAGLDCGCVGRAACGTSPCVAYTSDCIICGDR